MAAFFWKASTGNPAFKCNRDFIVGPTSNERLSQRQIEREQNARDGRQHHQRAALFEGDGE